MAGLTLMGTMVAIVLSGAIAAISGQLISNQALIAKINELSDARQSILTFYTEMLKNESIVQCTIENNTSLKNYIKQHQNTSGTSNIALIPPATGSTCNTTSPLIPSTTKKLGESISEHKTDGWWELQFKWEAKGLGTVDFILDLCLKRSAYKTAYPGIDLPKLKWDCAGGNNKIVRVRYSENSVMLGTKNCKDGTGERAVVNIALHGGGAANSRKVTCSTSYLVEPKDCSPGFMANLESSGKITCSKDKQRSGIPVGGVDYTNDGTGFKSVEQEPTPPTKVIEESKVLVQRAKAGCSGGLDGATGILNKGAVSCGEIKGFSGLDGEDMPCGASSCICLVAGGCP